MGCRGVHFALTDNDEKELLERAGNDDAILELLKEEIEERWDEQWLQETDKAWDAIHRCLTDGTLEIEDKSPRHMCILGGRQMYSGNDYIISYLTPAQVEQVAESIHKITVEDFREQYYKIDEDNYGVDLGEEDFGYTWEYFVDLKAFFAKASAANRPVVFSVDQ